jgi:hypothetical protein
MLSTGLWWWYINITITILDIIYRPVFYIKYVSETGYYLRQVEATQSDPIDRASLCLRRPPEDGERIQNPKRCVLNKGQDDGKCPELW